MSTAGTRPKRLLLLGDTTLEPLAGAIASAPGGPELEVKTAPYGQVHQILLDAQHPAWQWEPDYILVWTAPQLMLPSFRALLGFEPVRPEAVLAEAQEFAAAVRAAAARVRLALVPSWILPGHQRWIQSMTWREGGVANLLARANLTLASRWAGDGNIVMLDAAHWQAGLGRESHDPRMYAVAKVLYTPALMAKAAAEIKAVLRGALGLSRKVMVCDLDNTLWGGVAGDDGPQGLRLGAPDAVGECFRAAQEVLRALRARGVLLAICSKNDEALALSIIDSHPGMVLRRGDFAAWQINWNQKADNLRVLAETLNLGLDAFVFLDDSPEERDQVRTLLPEVYVPELPASPAALAPLVASLDCFETPSLSREDAQRTAFYQAEQQRRAARPSADVGAWLASLCIRVQASPLTPATLPRAAQLLNKTNQFNLSLRRMEVDAFNSWSREPGHAAYVFDVADKFGDSGLTALATLSRENGGVRIVDFVMSCRVMGKQVEEAILALVAERAEELGGGPLSAPAVEGPRNAPAREFFRGKYAGPGPGLDLSRIAVPSFIELVTEATPVATSI